MKIQEVIDMLTRYTGEGGMFKPDDEIVMEWWSYEDVLSFVEGDDYYGEVTDEVAREVWDEVSWRLGKFDNVDNDIVRDTISEVFDERIGGA